MTDNAIKVMLVDDHAVVRVGYRRLIEKNKDMRVISDVGNGVAAYQQYKTNPPDVVVLDLSMPGKGGIEVIRHLRKWDGAARILVFTMHDNIAYAMQAFQAGAKGYITKSSQPDMLIEAIREVFSGTMAMSPDISHKLALARVSDRCDELETLTTREFDIFRMIADAKSTADIASTLNLSTKTVSNYHSLIKAKLGVTSDVELAHLAIRLSIVHARQ
jgi:DNA-binding NarL/FixJ family response regulator